MLLVSIQAGSMEAEPMENEKVYGDSKFTLWEKVRILQEWAPVLTYVHAFLGTHDPHSKALIVSDACEWLASKTPNTKVDDELVSHVTAVLKSPQGEALLRWVVARVEESGK